MVLNLEKKMDPDRKTRYPGHKNLFDVVKKHKHEREEKAKHFTKIEFQLAKQLK